MAGWAQFRSALSLRQILQDANLGSQSRSPSPGSVNSCCFKLNFIAFLSSSSIRYKCWRIFLKLNSSAELFLLLYFVMHLYLLIVSSYLLICIFLLAKSLKLILEISATYRIGQNSSQLSARLVTNLQVARAMRDFREQCQTVFRVTVCLSSSFLFLFFLSKTMYN